MNIKNAVSVVIHFEGKFLLVQRQNALTAFPGYHAFVGGKVDDQDFTGNDTPHLEKWNNPEKCPEALKLPLLRAVFREVAEEIGTIENFLTEIYYLGFALTPDFNPVRFATYFFCLDLSACPHIKPDVHEIREAKWYTATQFLDKFRSGDALLVPPIYNLMVLLENNSFREVANHQLAFDFRYDRDFEVPAIESIHGLHQIMPRSETLPPADRTNAFFCEGLLIDPSPRGSDGGREVQLLKNTLSKKNLRVTHILLTHHHPDHHQHSQLLAREWKVPIFLSADTKTRIERVYRSNYFEGVETRIVQEGDIVGNWKGNPLMIFETPGHDQGQLGIAPKNLKWFIVGDLIQGMGTVVVGGDEGDMGLYYLSLKKVIALNPEYIFPSHGIGLGGVFFLEKALQHRLEREKQVLQLYGMQKTVDEIVREIYFNTPQELLKYARINIESHLKKLRLEGAI